MIDLNKIGSDAALKAKHEAVLKVLEELRGNPQFVNGKKAVKLSMLAVELGISNNTVDKFLKELDIEL